MKGKIITCQYAYNYGAVLQTYALCHYLNLKGIDTEVINYKPYYYRGSTKSKNKLKLIVRRIIRIPDNIKSEAVFSSFLREYIPLTEEYHNCKEILQANLEADIFIAGSDQIWNYNLPNGKDQTFYLKFASDSSYKISYAASLSCDEINEEQSRLLRKSLDNFDCISVREFTALKILNKAGIDDVEVVADPVYLLTAEAWKAMAKCPGYKPKRKYILVYAFNRQREIFTVAKELAQKYGYDVYSINTFWEDILQGTNHYYWNCKPEEFLYLINNAECIVTNSFHGLSFSMIFNRPVLLFEKDDKGNSRMKDLLKTLDIQESVLVPDKRNLEIPKLPFHFINNRIAELRNHSIEYIDKCIDILNERKKQV